MLFGRKSFVTRTFNPGGRDAYSPRTEVVRLAVCPGPHSSDELAGDVQNAKDGNSAGDDHP